MAVNRSVAFKIEFFEPREGFKPAKPYKTKLKWSDASGAEQSKLLIAEPEKVVAEIVEVKAAAAKPARRAPRRPARGRKGASGLEAVRN